MYSLYKFIEKIYIPYLDIVKISKYECYHMNLNNSKNNNFTNIHKLFNTSQTNLPYHEYSGQNDVFYIGPSINRKNWSSNVQQIIKKAIIKK